MVTSIGDYAFYGCPALTVSVPNGLESHPMHSLVEQRESGSEHPAADPNQMRFELWFVNA